MSDLARIGVAIDSSLLARFDELIEQRGYTNRSEAFRDLIRDELVQKSWELPEADVVGTVTLVYNHHVRLLNEKLTDMQHHHHQNILSTMHVHLDHDSCLEVAVLRGPAKAVRALADDTVSQRGVVSGDGAWSAPAVTRAAVSVRAEAARRTSSASTSRSGFIGNLLAGQRDATTLGVSGGLFPGLWTAAYGRTAAFPQALRRPWPSLSRRRAPPPFDRVGR